MSDDIKFVGSTIKNGTCYAKFSMPMGNIPTTFQQSALQLREDINKMKSLGKSPEKIAVFQEGLDAITP